MVGSMRMGLTNASGTPSGPAISNSTVTGRSTTAAWKCKGGAFRIEYPAFWIYSCDGDVGELRSNLCCALSYAAGIGCPS